MRKTSNLATVKATGVGGRIRKQDVLAAAEAAKAAPEPAKEAPAAARSAAREAPSPAAALAHLRGTTQKANRIRQLTAKKTRESLQVTAQLTQTHEVDVTKIVALRAKAKAKFAEQGRRQPDLPAVLRQGRHRRAQDAPDHQCQLQRGHQRDHLLRRRAPRRRGRHRPGSLLRRDPQRRPSVTGRTGPRHRGHRHARPLGRAPARRVCPVAPSHHNIGSQGALFDTRSWFRAGRRARQPAPS